MRQEQLQRHERGIHAPRRTSEGHLRSRHGSVPGAQQHQARAGDRLSRGFSGAWTGRAGGAGRPGHALYPHWITVRVRSGCNCRVWS